jgi:hypothetical protein
MIVFARLHSMDSCFPLFNIPSIILSKNQDPDNAAVLDLHSTTALEGCLILVRAQAKRVPKSDRILHTKFLRRVEAGIASGVSPEEVSGNSRFPASTERGGSVQAPIAPSRTGQSILEEHPNDRLKVSTEYQHLLNIFSSCASPKGLA